MIPTQLVIDGFKTSNQRNPLEEACEVFGINKVNNFVEVASYILRWYAGIDRLNFTDYSLLAFTLEKLQEELNNDRQ